MFRPSDLHLVLLTGAAQRDDASLLPPSFGPARSWCASGTGARSWSPSWMEGSCMTGRPMPR